MKIVNRIASLRQEMERWRKEGSSVALVPTMGNLHAGHLQLVQEARAQADRVVVSIFVNPLQFGPAEDFKTYPRTEVEDAGKLGAAGVNLLYMPDVAEMYPGGSADQCHVDVPGLSDVLCGAFRPGHFRGVATVVLKLFNQVQPDIGVFGEKDFQQCRVISRMAADLDLPVNILTVPTVREADGLAMSSRNQYLTPEERTRAGLLYQQLCLAADVLKQGERNIAHLESACSAAIQAAGFQVDYFAVRRQHDLALPATGDRQLVILVAARLGKARLIDNLTCSLTPAF